MKIYHYDKQTRAYVGEDLADPNPLEEGEFLIPACATPIKPPEVETDQVAVFLDGGGWTIKSDHRGKKYWLSDGTLAVMNEIGPLPNGATLEEPMASRVQKVEIARRMLYREKVDPLINEALIKKAMADDYMHDQLMTEAVEERAKIQVDNPWPSAE